ncbi:PAS domain-containing protein [Methylobacterium sp. RAS18]|nr:PAS domain-containing protein [Methylobacterium sp. RAS18]
MFYNDVYAPALAERHPDALGRPIADVWGEIWGTIGADFVAALRTGEGSFKDRYELLLIRNGVEEQTCWNYSVTPIRDDEGYIVGLLNQAFEVTGQVLAERCQQEAEQRLRDVNASLVEMVAERTEERDLMWDTAPDLMLVIDFEGVFRRVNPAWTRLLGYAPHELVDHHVNEFVLSEDHAQTVEAYTEAAEGGLPRGHQPLPSQGRLDAVDLLGRRPGWKPDVRHGTGRHRRPASSS